MLGTKDLIIFSVFNKNVSTKINVANNSTTKDKLIAENVAFRELVGRFEGTNEACLVVDSKHETLVKAIAFKAFGQESILHIDALKNSYLEFAKGGIEKLGKFTQVDYALHSQLENFTCDTENKLLYVCK
jgi:hypothetical protein